MNGLTAPKIGSKNWAFLIELVSANFLEARAVVGRLPQTFWRLALSSGGFRKLSGGSCRCREASANFLEAPAVVGRFPQIFWRLLPLSGGFRKLFGGSCRCREVSANFLEVPAVVGRFPQTFWRLLPLSGGFRKFSDFHSLPFVICPNIRTFAQTNFK